MADTDVVTSINVGEGQNSIARLPCLASASGTLGVDFASGTHAWIYGERRACFGYAVVGCVAGLSALDRIELSFVITAQRIVVRGKVFELAATCGTVLVYAIAPVLLVFITDILTAPLRVS